MKKYIKIFCIIIFLLGILSGVVNAAESMITKEELQDALEDVIDESNYWDDFFDNYSNIQVFDDKITLKKGDIDYVIYYSIKNDKITFSYSFTVEKGMKYNEYSNFICGDYKVLQLLLYSAIADKYGLIYEDPTGYYNIILLNNILKGSFPRSKYTIVNSKTDADKQDDNVILVSEFGDKAIDVVDSQFKENYSFSDSEGINSFVCTLKKQNLSANSRKLSVDLTIDTTANFLNIYNKREELYKSQEKDAKEKSKYKIDLKVGQKLVIPWAKGIAIYGQYAQLNKNSNAIELEGAKEGITHGIIYTRTGGEESIYIKVEANADTKPYDDFVLEHKETDNIPEEKKDETPAPNPTTETPSAIPTVTEEKEEDDDKPITVIRVGFDDETNGVVETVTATPAQSEDTTTAKTVLPQTGEKARLLFAILLVLGIGYTSYKKYNNMKEIK